MITWGLSRTRVSLVVLLGFLILLMFPLTAQAAVWTDSYMYSFGDIVQIHGDGMAAAEPVAVSVYAPGMGPLAVQSDVVMADESGAFGDMFLMAPELPGGVYTVVATGQESGAVFTCEFDPIKVESWVSRSAYGPLPLGESLSFDLTYSGNNGPEEGHYVEWGDGAVELFAITDFPLGNGTRTVTLTHTYTDAGAHTATVTVMTKDNGLDKWVSLSRSVTIAQKQITGSFTASDKVYDGGTTASVLTSALAGVNTGDVVWLTGTAAFTDANVGTAKTVTFTGASLAGPDAGNYVLDPLHPVASTKATITPASLTVIDVTSADKIYNGTTAAVMDFSGAKLVGVVSPDEVTLEISGGSGDFSSKNVGPWDITVAGLTIDGAGAGNYTLTQPTVTGFKITAKHITGAFTTQDKIYDSTNVASVLTRSLVGAVTDDEVSLSGGTATFSSAHVGTRTVTLASAVLAGGDKNNYVLDSVATEEAKITQRDLTVGVSSAGKVFDNTTDAIVDLSSNGVLGDDLGLHYKSASFADKSVGTWLVSVAGISIDGTDADNYNLLNTIASTTAKITQAPTGMLLEVQSVQYTDVSTIKATISPASINGAPVQGTVTFRMGATTIGSASLSGNVASVPYKVVLTPAGNYPITAVFASLDPNFRGCTQPNAMGVPLVVTKENASVTSLDAPSVMVSPGSTSGKVSVSGSVDETQDGSTGGDLTKMDVTVALIGASGGNNYTLGTVAAGADGSFTLSKSGVALDAYEVQVTVTSDYFVASPYSDALAVYDPSLGFATGGGWFKGIDGDKTSFGFVTKYGKNGTNAKGNLVVVRHALDGSIYRLKSNSLSALSIGAGTGYGWASLIGKATFAYVQPDGTSQGGGNYSFTMYVEDRNQPGTGADVFSLRVTNPTGSFSASALDSPMKYTISGGNIVAPHTAK